MEKNPIQAVPKSKKTCAEAYEKASCVSGFRKKMVYPLLDHTYLPYLSARAINYTLEYGIPAPCFLIHVHYGPPEPGFFLQTSKNFKIIPELLGIQAILNRKS